jgi:hypothetical protein
MAGRACHVVGSATQVGLTQALGLKNRLFGPRSRNLPCVDDLAFRSRPRRGPGALVLS